MIFTGNGNSHKSLFIEFRIGKGVKNGETAQIFPQKCCRSTVSCNMGIIGFVGTMEIYFICIAFAFDVSSKPGKKCL